MYHAAPVSDAANVGLLVHSTQKCAHTVAAENGMKGSTMNSRAAIEIVRQWEGGPLRQITTERKGNWIARSDGTFAGQYVCDACSTPSIGVYGPLEGNKWLCGGC